VAGGRRGEEPRATEVLGDETTAPAAGDLASPSLSPSRSPAFASIETLVALGPPARGLFLPFVGNAYRSCQPRVEPCADRRLGLMLVSADGAGLEWTPVDEGAARPADVRVDGLDVSTVGAAPPAPERSSYLLTLLDLRPTAGRLRTVERSLDADDLLTAPAEPGPLVRPTITGAALPVPPQPYGMPTPFEEPRAASADDFPARVPVYVVAPWADKVEVVYGVLPAADWRREGVVPLLGTGRLPYFATTAAGVTGLYVPGDVAGGRNTGGDTAQTATGSPLVAVAVALLALIASVGVGAVIRRRREE
jgi:hypothetical protein